MATRAHIVVKDTIKQKEHFVYHHWDGYIEGVGKDLKKFIKNDYKPTDYTAKEFCQQLENWNDDNSYEYENWGIHGDEDYIYYVNISSESHTISVLVKKEHAKRNDDGTWDTWWEEITDYSEDITI